MVHRVLAAAGGALLSSACAGELDNADELLAALQSSDPCTTLGITDPQTQLVEPTCANTPGCHGTVSASRGLVLEGDDLSGLIDQASTSPESNCAGLPWIDSSSVADSLILRILEDPPPCSFQMPLNEPPLTANEKGCLREWVRSLVEAP